MNGLERKGGRTKKSEKAVVNLTVQAVNEKQLRAIVTGISGLEFALGALQRSLGKKLDAIAKKLEDPNSGEVVQLLADLKNEADELEKEARKHGASE